MERTPWQVWTKLFFLVMDNQIFSCPCLYDQCLVSFHVKENLEELELRISRTVNKYWMTHINITPNLVIQVNAKIFVCCITHSKRMLDNLVLSSTDHQALVSNCIRRDHGNYKDNYMNCFRFYFEDRMLAIGFCYDCIKYLLARTPDTFLLHRVKINNGIDDS